MSAYIIQVIFYHLVVYTFEKYVRVIIEHKTEPDEQAVVWIHAESDSDGFKTAIILFLAMNTLMVLVLMYS